LWEGGSGLGVRFEVAVGLTEDDLADSGADEGSEDGIGVLVDRQALFGGGIDEEVIEVGRDRDLAAGRIRRTFLADGEAGFWRRTVRNRLETNDLGQDDDSAGFASELDVSPRGQCVEGAADRPNLAAQKTRDLRTSGFWALRVSLGEEIQDVPLQFREDRLPIGRDVRAVLLGHVASPGRMGVEVVAHNGHNTSSATYEVSEIPG
jgi:hypothetical protein